MEIVLLDRTLPTLHENLAFDEALLLAADEGSEQEILRFWEWPQHAVVLGAGGALQADVDAAECLRAGVPIARRASGGGTVLLGRGCLLFSLVLRFERERALKDVNASYRYILGRIIQALGPFASLKLAGISDLAIGQRKCSGNAQQRKRSCLLHHGTLLYRFDLGQIGRFLRLPDKQPDYRESRGHEEFVTNLNADAEDLKRSIASAWDATERPVDIPVERIRELVATKYALEEWSRRR